MEERGSLLSEPLTTYFWSSCHKRTATSSKATGGGFENPEEHLALGSTNFSVKGPTVTILSFAGLILWSLQFNSALAVTATMGNTSMNRRGCGPVKLYL